MTSIAFVPQQRPGPTARYRCFRALVRFWLALMFRHFRILQSERALLDGPTILLVNQPARWLYALILVAAFDESIFCLVDRQVLEGWWRRALARAFQMTPFDAEQPKGALRACENLLGTRQIVAIFTGSGMIDTHDLTRRFAVAATLAMEAEFEYSRQLDVAVVPAHLLAPRSPRGDALIHACEPLFAQDFLATQDEPLSAQTAQFAAALARSCQSNPFSLQPDSLSRFLADTEQVMREDLEEDWAARQNWKQTAKGFQLSSFVETWCERLNQSEPARLIALRQAVDAYLEVRRRWALRHLRDEGGEGLGSVLRRLLVWTESVIGFPVALYGLINHLVACLVLMAAGLFKRQDRRSKPERWFLGAAIVLACYAGEIAVVSHWLGRSAAGYYAVSLPLSGAYLARYVWLWTRRARFLLRDFRVPFDYGALQRMRKELLARFNAARDAYAEILSPSGTEPADPDSGAGNPGNRPAPRQDSEVKTL